jgi:hypothetical protein
MPLRDSFRCLARVAVSDIIWLFGLSNRVRALVSLIDQLFAAMRLFADRVMPKFQ